MSSRQPLSTVFVTGATGYVGGRLVPRLLHCGHTVRCFVRSPQKLASRSWSTDPRVTVIQGDLFDERLEPLVEALRGCEAAYYLVHSMLSAGEAYGCRDREMAKRFALAAERAGVSRIIYLGGLGELGANLSDHLESRREVGSILASGSVPTTELRAAMIIGSGSASFEILRYLVERLPIMVTPKWVRTLCQPIAIRNVVEYLVACLGEPRTIGQRLDIGGPDVLSYAQLMRIMAQELGLRRRLVVPVPVLTPRLSSLWIHLVTPLSKDIARPLAEGLRNEVLCRDARAQELMPQQLVPVRQAIGAAIRRREAGQVETFWSMAGRIPGDPDWAGGTVFSDSRESVVDAPSETVFRAVSRIGGDNGWYGANWLWSIRGWLDRLFGGPGLRRGRRHPEDLCFGEAVDFWRVTALEQGRRLSLRAEMKLPGQAMLEFEVEPLSPHRSRLRQMARFLPRGLSGIVYWYCVLPLHSYVFRRMLRGIRSAAESRAGWNQHKTAA